MSLKDVNQPSENVVVRIEKGELLNARLQQTSEEFEQFCIERDLFWEENFDLFISLDRFKVAIDEIIEKVIRSAINRKIVGKPAMTDQSVEEHLDHMTEHSKLWLNNQEGDEPSVEEQAKHTLCRAMLAYYTYQHEKYLQPYKGLLE